MPTPVIIDCDPGHDDVFALWLAAGNPEIDLLAVTTVSGNGSLEATTLNARVALTVAGVEGVPVAAGAARPLVCDTHHAVDIHGDNALGGPHLPAPTVPLDPRSAVQLIADTLAAAPGPVTLIPTGPLTNIAQFLAAHPELHAKVARIIWMGGSTGAGNITSTAEFNAWADPDAAHAVFSAGLDVTMVGLNVTHTALATAAVRARIAAVGNASAAFGFELLEFFSKAYEHAQNMPDGPVHDPITVAIAIDSSICETQHVRVDVDVGDARGTTLIDSSARPRNAHVATKLDVERFWDLVVDAVGRLA